MTRRSICPSGFTLTEMIAVIVLSSAFGLISTHLFTQTMSVLNSAPAQTDAMTRFESVAQTLRQDAWGATSFSTAGPTAIQIDTVNKPGIRWEIDPAGDIYRTQGAERRRWMGVGTSAVLETDGPSLILRSTAQVADVSRQVRFVSLVQIAAAHGEGK
jgi:prepilin-type N-terminal cleavage/methylation domain-containing protein